ncbi:type VI secretion system baseplate subunit TssG [Methylorubrum extorquens]|uniref:Type VI secretion system baseplate subunit TssG n=1 Tax=Methylorubrum extorquens TaxID=408 RepID=A0AAX3WC86_METEX|nr:type VI secretion system baseplate subunit TssG [Methylorubrum extorquens]WHQ68586.1 type VI secretion system baseplate subunit TssG [Methylorubrum extorquens]
MKAIDSLIAEPWRHDLFATLRRIERSFPESPRIGDSESRRHDRVTLGQNPYLAFPASTIAAAEHDEMGRLRLLTQFLGLLGPQGALPLSVTDETYGWLLEHDDALPRFLDVIQNRFLQLFYRAWADARPIAQHEHPAADRFEAYAGAPVGLGSPVMRGLDAVPDADKIHFAGLLGSAARSGSRLRNAVAGLFGLTVEVEEFVGTFLEFEPGDRSRLGGANARLGQDLLLGASVFSVEDRFRLRIFAADLAEYEGLLPGERRCRMLADFVLFYLGDEFEWDVELTLPVAAVEPLCLGRFGRLGYTSWIGQGACTTGASHRRDARFHPSERAGRLDDRAGSAA